MLLTVLDSQLPEIVLVLHKALPTILCGSSLP
jgi:hypothetical protein